ncbi:MAG: hypothetical protein KZY61_11135 [Clostridiaceae bacterium]|nr:hypothetical protein [Clostridiaceae bacterium]MBW4860210.1 hypothetical protein [Clostridiaceae bacterium]MBW4869187.1 hypothetical protein [Clostridiaceae bacterium]
MNIFREIRFYFKKNSLLFFLELIILTLFLTLVYVFALFTIGINEKTDKIENIYNGKEIYRLIDKLEDPEEFSDFLNSKSSVSVLSNFYNELDTDKNFQFLSVFDQFIPIENFKGDNTFDYAYGEDMEVKGKYKDEISKKIYQNAKSMQMNKNSFKFYDIELARGKEIDWEKVDYSTGRIPILLGNDYSGIYDVGDVLIGDYYGKDFKFEVVGFIKRNTYIFYNGSSEKYLDNYIVVPYPLRLSKIDNEMGDMESEFYGILYSAMINGDIAIEKSGNSLQTLLKNLDRISQKTSFDKYTIIGVRNFVVQYNNMIAAINNNKKIILFLLILNLIIMFIILKGISHFIYSKRKKVYYLYFLNGCNKGEIYKIFSIDLILPYILAFILNIIITWKYKFFDEMILIILAIIIFLVFSVIYRIFIKKLHKDLENGFR